MAGARPNFMKVAPLVKLFKKNNFSFKLIHTGQHYDFEMSEIFFNDLEIPKPDIFLNVGSGSHAVQTAKIMIEFEKAILKENPDLIILVGDVNSTIACALVAKKMFIKIAHVEAGLRSFDKTMPEEINRILTDQLSDFLFITEKSGEFNLKKEGIDSSKIFFVGNIMIENLLNNIDKARRLDSVNKFNLKKKKFALITAHRPSNVDNKENLEKIIEIINYLQDFITVFFPIHPRTKNNIEKFDLINKFKKVNLILSKPVGYLEFLNLMENSKMILTDSGGIQEEASFLNIPILTLRKNTERPITVEKGTNTIINCDFSIAKEYIDKIFSNRYKVGQKIENWDGRTAQRILDILKLEFFEKK